MKDLQCDLCGGVGEHHLTASLNEQHDKYGTHLHLCEDCYSECYYDIAEKLKEIETDILLRYERDSGNEP